MGRGRLLPPPQPERLSYGTKLTERQQLEVLIEWLRHGERSGYDCRAPTKASTRSGLHNEPHFDRSKLQTASSSPPNNHTE